MFWILLIVVILAVSGYLTYRLQEPYLLIGICSFLLIIPATFIGANYFEETVHIDDPVPMEQFSVDGRTLYVSISGDEVTFKVNGKFVIRSLDRVMFNTLDQEEEPYIVTGKSVFRCPPSFFYFRHDDYTNYHKTQIHINLQ